jgi:hypothetical protein
VVDFYTSRDLGIKERVSLHFNKHLVSSLTDTV